MIKFGKKYKNDNMPYILNINDNIDNVLKIIVSLPYSGEKGSEASNTGNKDLDEILKEAYPVLIDYNEIYEITFESYIMYQTRNESFAYLDENSKVLGEYFTIIKNSSYLKMVKSITFYNDIFDDKYMHYGIFSWNHVIDIISAEEPKIAKLENHTEE
ncbi:hypothetical protein [uncultured Leptotrichia sp.]|uniref:hypothetical protein n=1 Tax=uncultured Leptotrichia sp. TaxID=159271 RepID=UPI0025F08758|nr:hypothetical protein [uncultured Leptotrichia sp.]